MRSSWPGSVRSPASVGSIDSLASVGSIRSLGSVGSIVSIGSVGSILSVGSAGSILSVASAGSLLSVASSGSILSVRSDGALLCRDGRRMTTRQALGHAATITGTALATGIVVAGTIRLVRRWAVRPGDAIVKLS